MKLLLIRHGQSVDAVERRFQRPEAPLSEHGRWQATCLAERLAAPPIDALYCSTMGRAHETATIVAQRRGQPLNVRHELREISVGQWTGQPHAQFLPHYRAEYDLWRDGGPSAFGFELLAECQARMIAALGEIVANHADDSTLALVGHGTAHRLFVLHVLGLPVTQYRLLAGWHNTAITIVHHQAGRYRLSTLNDATHLGTTIAIDGPDAGE